MQNEQQQTKRQLDQELQSLTFTSYDTVIKKTHPKTFRQKLNQLWNKELHIPLVPFSAAAVLFIGISVTTIFLPTNQEKAEQTPARQLVEEAGNVYWSDLYEKAVAKE